jgi:hypothetical protein
MSNTQTTCENTVPMPEPTYYTKAEIERETLAVYRRAQSYGWGDGMAEQEAAEFYAYHLTKLHLRKLEAERQIEVVCAWCGVHIRGAEGVDAAHTSHGICATCAEAFEPEAVRA